MLLDYTYRIRSPHRPGSLARVAGTIAQGEGLIGDVVTISAGQEASIRASPQQAYWPQYWVASMSLRWCSAWPLALGRCSPYK